MTSTILHKAPFTLWIIVGIATVGLTGLLGTPKVPVLEAFALHCSNPEWWSCRSGGCLRHSLHSGGCDFCVVGLHKLSTTAVHVAVHLPTHLLFSVSRVELIDTVQLAISIVHDASSFSLTIFKRVLTSEIVAQFMGENEPGFL